MGRLKLNRKTLTLLAFILILLGSILINLNLNKWEVKAQPTLAITPNHGVPESTVQVNGTIETPNGEYVIKFDSWTLSRGNASDTMVTANITVPENATKGEHTIFLVDVTTGNAANQTFTVETAFFLNVTKLPGRKQFLEGQNVNLWVGVKGGEPEKDYIANITVTDPSNSSYSKEIEITTDSYGYVNESLTYPADFGTSAHTNYTGVYVVEFNKTANEPLAKTEFFIGITNATEYHRFETVKIYAVGYEPGTNATIIVKAPNGTEIHENRTKVLSNGTVLYYWKIPAKAPMGEYSLNITGKTEKKVNDTQTFSVPGFPVKISALNLRGSPVSSVDIRIYEDGVSVSNITTEEDGSVNSSLEIGSYMLKALYYDKVVGNQTIDVDVGGGSYNITCMLTYMRIQVFDGKTSEPLPFITLQIDCNYTVENGEERYRSFKNVTNLAGITEFPNVFVYANYTVAAFRYEKAKFYEEKFIDLEPTETFELNITCPVKTLNLTVYDSENHPFAGVEVRVYEWTSGLAQPAAEAITNNEGKAFFNLTFGWYLVQVSKKDIIANETKVELTYDKNVSIYCKLLNLDFSVKVTDYFSNPIPNLNVVLERVDTPEISYSEVTDGNGIARFKLDVGGEYKVKIYFSAEDSTPYIMQSVKVARSGEITIHDGRHVILFGTLIETGMFTSILVIVVIAVLALMVYVIYRLRRR